jgi:hypothetical protein
VTTPAPMPAGWYDDPFTDHLQRYWTGDSWTKETRPRPGAVEPPPAYPAATQPAAAPAGPDGAPIRDWLIPSILAIIFCAWPLAIPGLIFAIKANSSKKQGNMAAAAQQASKARLFVILSVALGIVVWIYLGFIIATTEVPTDQGNLTPFGA